ncbi:hypothetical protein DDB_G0272050 [Dictyostelium discoideum AX4]|uniref:Uncharacterized protein n=1 Tax=Dictyostelium discoideum TaxID=44689 RepID=Q55A73_DICDI|nr:hypothetical protein DDB_G0272050 [Dictyostelium discoideum AX4]EAL71459.1 hypothetical protein DDB_G0272050 [Dictyostelium discoideum AX4]|eukprot:XP_645393.1 hypothetical protein DDB_G0272050 [Dictyostelium discoideum AX4]
MIVQFDRSIKGPDRVAWELIPKAMYGNQGIIWSLPYEKYKQCFDFVTGAYRIMFKEKECILILLSSKKLFENIFFFNLIF